MPSDLPVICENCGDGTTLRITTALTTAHADQLAEIARSVAATGGNVTVDVSNVGQLGLAALQVLTALTTTIRARGDALHFVGVSADLRSTLDVSGFAAVLAA